MRYETIADIYSANQKMRERLFSTLTDISAEIAIATPDDEKWTIQQIAEHVSMVDFGISRICAKLLSSAKAENIPSDGSFSMSDNYIEGAAKLAVLKVEAPERVQPTGGVSIAEAIARIKASTETLDSFRSDFEQFDTSDHKFPHPYLGNLTAGEWLVLAGVHMHRHNEQIKILLDKIRQ